MLEGVGPSDLFAPRGAARDRGLTAAATDWRPFGPDLFTLAKAQSAASVRPTPCLSSVFRA